MGEKKEKVGGVRDITELKKLIFDMGSSRAELQGNLEQLEKFAEVAVGRELKMAKMEEEMESLKAKLRELTSGQEGIK